MPDGLELSNDILLEPALVDAISAEGEAGMRSRLLAQLHQQQERAQAALQQRRAEFDALYEKAAATPNVAEIAQLSAVVREKGRTAAELLRPGIENLRTKLALPLVLRNHEGQRAFQDGLDIALAWLVLYESLDRKLLQLLAERRAAAGEILRARPVAGVIDYAELSREHIARYPKIRARLAE